MGTVKNNRLMPVNSDKTGNRKDFYSKVQFIKALPSATYQPSSEGGKAGT